MGETPYRSARTVLLIDDSPEDRFLYRRYLRLDPTYEYRFVEAPTAQEGARLYRESLPDCVVLDYSLPDSTGLEWLEEVQENGDELLPVVLVTGNGDERVAAQAIQRHAADYLVKGRITQEGLCHTVDRAVQRVAADRELRSLRRSVADRARRELRETEDRYLQLVENLPDAVLLLLARRITYANAAASRILGAATAADLVGDRFLPYVAEADRSAARGLIGQAEAGDTSPPLEMVVQSSYRDVLVEAFAMPVQVNGESGLQLVLRDVSALVRALREARAASRAKASFLAAVSRDVRTPISAMAGTARQLARDADRPESVARHAGRIGRAAERLHETLSDLIALASPDLDESSLQIEPVNLVEAALAAVERARGRAEEAGVELTLGDVQHGYVSADAAALRRCLDAVLRHAVGAEGVSEVVVEVEPREGGMKAVVVSHDGAALAPDQIAALDQPYEEQGGRSGDFGPVVATRLASLMHGSLAFDEACEGDRFCSVLALRSAALDEEAGGEDEESADAVRPQEQ